MPEILKTNNVEQEQGVLTLEPLRAVLISPADLETVLAKIAANANKKWLTLNEAAEYLRISRKQIYNLKASNKIPFYKLEGKILFKTSELDRIIEKNKVESIGELKQRATNRGR